IDINPACRELAEDQIEIRIGDQSDAAFLDMIAQEFGAPDAILDDGSHPMSHIQAAFAALYPKVDRNGVYLVEGLHTAYWDEYEGGMKRRGSFIETCKDLIDELNAEHTRGAVDPTPFTRSTLSMHVYDGAMVFETGRHTTKRPMQSGSGSFRALDASDPRKTTVYPAWASLLPQPLLLQQYVHPARAAWHLQQKGEGPA